MRVRLLCILIILGLLYPLAAYAQKAPEFTLKDLSGRSYKLSDFFPENVVVLNFWATWCVPCAKELPHLQRFQDRYRDKGLRVLAVSTDGPDRAAAVSSFIGRYGYTMTVLLDTESQVVSLYNPRLNLPFTVLMDKGGKIRYVHQGYSPGDERLLEQKVAALLGETKAPPKPKPALRVDESFLLRVPKDEAGDSAPAMQDSRALNQLELTLAKGGALVGARVDADLAFSPLEPHIRLAKRYAQYSAKRLRARAGDFYYSMGRGLVFSLLKVFEEEGLDYVVDTTVDGGLAAFNAGPIGGEVFGGWIDRPEGRGVRDKVLGGSLRWGKAGRGAIRIQGVTANLERGGEFGNHRVDQGSFSLELPNIGGLADVYGEFSLIRRRAYDAEAPANGQGLYLGSKLHLGRFSLLLEVKDYRELNFEYARPPLLESEELDIVAAQFDIDRTDMSGFSARLDYYSPAEATLIYGKFLLVDDHPSDHPFYGAYDRDIGHVFAGLEKKFGDGAYINGLAGWRWENDTSVAFMMTDGQTFHYQVNASEPLGRGWSLEADWKHKVFDGRYDDYSEVRSSLSLHKSPRLVVSLLYERTTEPEVVLLAHKKNWWAGQVEVRLPGGHSLRLFAGSTKGSIKCAGGVCRYFPPFEGVRLEAFLRF